MWKRAPAASSPSPSPNHRLGTRPVASRISSLGVPADRAAFVDDRADNVEGARAAGLHAAVHVDLDGTAAFLADHGVPV